jgi:hypothetical protein
MKAKKIDRLSTTVIFSGNIKMLDNHIDTIEQLYEWRENIYINKIKSMSNGCIFAILLISMLKYDVKEEYYYIPKNFLKKFHHIFHEFLDKMKEVPLIDAVEKICFNIEEYLPDDIIDKCNDLLSIYYTKSNKDIILEQEFCDTFTSKKDIIKNIYQSMSIPLLDVRKLIKDDKYIYCDGIAFIEKLDKPKDNEIILYSLYKLNHKCVILNLKELGQCNKCELNGGMIYYNASHHLYEPIFGYTLPYSDYLPNFIKNDWNFRYSQGIYTYNFIKLNLFIYYKIPFLHKNICKVFNKFGWIFGYKFIKNINHIYNS